MENTKVTINRDEKPFPPPLQDTCDDAVLAGDERQQDVGPQHTGADDVHPTSAERHTSRPEQATKAKAHSRPLVDLVVLVMALATPTVLVLAGQVGVAALLAVAEFGAVIMRAWWSRP